MIFLRKLRNKMENEKYLTITALTKYISYKFDHDTNLKNVLLEGEISNFKANSSGHFYFTLKDENAQIQAIMFASAARNVNFRPIDGDKVYVKGDIKVYEATGRYQIYITSMNKQGVGDLYLKFEQLKKELSEQGYFNIDHKRPIPLYPKTVGVITSPTGAAVRDIIQTIKRRYPICDVILYPCQVQGDTAHIDVVKQIKKANADKLCDVLIIGRGGGSLEDLWAFNEKDVALAIYDSEIPTISAVGHEIDYTISDFVADKRAVTPTQGAMLATPDIESLKAEINYYLDSYNKRIKQIFQNLEINLVNISTMLDSYKPTKALENKEKELKNKYQQLKYIFERILINKENSFRVLDNTLQGINPLKIMDRGYSITSINDKIITDVNEVKIDDVIKTEMKNGYIKAKVIEVKENER